MPYRSHSAVRERRLSARACLVSSLMALFLTPALVPAAATSGPALPSGRSGYELRERGRAASEAARWVAEGDGVLAYGAGRTIWFTQQSSGAGSSITVDEPVSSCAMLARFAYLAQPGEGLRVVDVRDPSSPVDLGLIPMNGDDFRVGSWADSVLVAAGGIGLKVMALPTEGTCSVHHPGACLQPSDATTLRERGFLPLSQRVTALASEGFTAYLALGDGTLLAVDLSDPARPSELWRASLGGPVTALAVSGRAIVVSGPAGIRALSLAGHGLGPRLAALPLPADGLLAEGRALYAAGRSGLRLLEMGPVGEATVSVSVANFSFTPSTVNLNVGDTVKWNWVGGTHSTTSGSCAGGTCTPDGTWDSGVMSSGTFSKTFSAPGDFPYYCSVHLSSMTGKVKVAAPSALSVSATASVTSGAPPLAVSFTSTVAGGTGPYTYQWAFGDGATSAEANPSHTFTSDGAYSVTLTVQDSVGATASAAPIAVTVSSSAPPPPVIASMRKLGAPFRIVVAGQNLQDGITVSIAGGPWSNAVWKNTSKVVLKGGASLKAVVPKNTPVSFVFTNPDGGTATFTFQWP